MREKDFVEQKKAEIGDPLMKQETENVFSCLGEDPWLIWRSVCCN